MKKGQISTGLLSIIGLLFSASIGISWNAFSKSDKAMEGVSEVKENIAEIRTDVRWIREALSNQKTLGSATTTQPINGYR